MPKVKIGVIGAGSHANHVHYPSLASMKEAEIAAICDINEERLGATAEKYGVEKRYSDYRDLLGKEELDAVYVILPPHQLYDVVVDCLKDGLNVFTEKPPGVSTTQTKSLAWYARKHSCKTMVGFNRRFIPLMRKARELVEGRGPINQCLSAFYKNVQSEEPPYYRGAVDALTSDIIHAVDALRWMGGEVREVRSSVRKLFADYWNSFNALVTFQSGAVGFLMSNWTAGSRMHTFEMHSKGISALVNPDDRALIFSDNKSDATVISTFEAAGSRDFHVYYGFYDENRHFVNCILRDKEPETSFEDAARTMELVDMIYSNAPERALGPGPG